MAVDMSIFKSRDTRPEIMVRMALVRLGLRHRVQARIGRYTADFLVEDRMALFVDGRFWHDPDFAAYRMREFWKIKIMSNALRDRLADREIRRRGLSVLRLWDDERRPSQAIACALRGLSSASSSGARSCRRHTSRRHP